MQDQAISLVFCFAGSQAELVREIVLPHETVEIIKNRISRHVKLAPNSFSLSARNLLLKDNQCLVGLRDNEVISVHVNQGVSPVPPQRSMNPFTNHALQTNNNESHHAPPVPPPSHASHPTHNSNPSHHAPNHVTNGVPVLPHTILQSNHGVGSASTPAAPPRSNLARGSTSRQTSPSIAPARGESETSGLIRSATVGHVGRAPGAEPPSIVFMPTLSEAGPSISTLPPRGDSNNSTSTHNALLSSFKMIPTQTNSAPNQSAAATANKPPSLFLSAPGLVSTSRSKENPELVDSRGLQGLQATTMRARDSTKKLQRRSGGLPPQIAFDPNSAHPIVDADNCSFTGPASCPLGDEVKVQLLARTNTRSLLSFGGASVQAQVDGPSKIEPSIIDNNNGTYFILFRPQQRGQYEVSAWINGSPVANGQRFQVNVAPLLNESPGRALPMAPTARALPQVAPRTSSFSTHSRENQLASVVLQKYIRGMNAYTLFHRKRLQLFSAKEILTSEHTYLANIRLLKVEFHTPLRSKNCIEHAKLDAIFSNIEMVAEVNSEFCIQLHHCLHDRIDLMQLANVFRVSSGGLKFAYQKYISAYNESIKALEAAQKESKAFKDFLDMKAEESTRENSPLRGLDLSSLLIMPVQRLPKYELLLREVIRHTGEDEEAYPELKSVFAIIQEVVSCINETKREIEDGQKMNEWRNVIIGLPDEFYNVTGRRFVDECSVKIKFKTEKNEKVKHVVLFTDALLIGNKKTKNDKSTFKMKIYVNLLKSVVEVVSDDTLKLVHGAGLWSMTFDTKAQCASWARHLEKLVPSLTKTPF